MRSQTKTLDELQKEMDSFGFYPDTRSALEIIEAEVKEEAHAHRAQDLFDRLVKEERWDEARQVAWLLWLRHSIDVGLFEDRPLKEE